MPVRIVEDDENEMLSDDQGFDFDNPEESFEEGFSSEEQEGESSDDESFFEEEEEA